MDLMGDGQAENIMNVGYIGIGIMGGAMAGNLLRAGHRLYIYR